MHHFLCVCVCVCVFLDLNAAKDLTGARAEAESLFILIRVLFHCWSGAEGTKRSLLSPVPSMPSASRQTPPRWS